MFALTERDRDDFRQWLSYIDEHRSVEDVRKSLEACLVEFANQKRFDMGIWYEGELAGLVSFENIDWAWKVVEISYMLAVRFRGKGLATKCCRLMVDYAFDELGLNRVEIRCAAENTKSQGIPCKLGFTKEGILRQAQWVNDGFVDLVVYGLLAGDWQLLRNNLA